ncbi:MAG TPA: GntR family transcriptional regulator [Stellaceae bacterium]|nr:GntR family transcriptional regulator [Stellaceae bacterium]
MAGEEKAFVDRMRERPKPQTFTQHVVNQLREMILCGDLEEGEQLRQDMLATALHVSRIPVREALRQLEAEGLVTFFPNRGAIVSELSLDDIREVFDARALLECDMLGRAIPKLTTEDFDRAEEVLASFDDAFAKGDVRVWGQLNWRFHSILYAPASRPRTMAMIQNLSFNVDRYLRLHLKLTRAIGRARTDHRRILDYCRKRKIEAACDYLRKHILDAGDELIKFLALHRELKASDSRRKTAG